MEELPMQDSIGLLKEVKGIIIALVFLILVIGLFL
jgi:hypothetical protein